MSKIYIHKLSGKRLTIKKLFGSVATCITDEPIKMPNSNFATTDTIVCSVDNLIEEKLF